MFGLGKKKKQQEVLRADFLKYFEMKSEDGKTEVIMDFNDETITRFLYAGATMCKSMFKNNPKIENYLNQDIYLGGQPLSVAICKDLTRSPHALRMQAEAKLAKALEVLREFEDWHKTKADVKAIESLGGTLEKLYKVLEEK